MLKNLIRLYALTVMPEPNKFILGVRTEFRDEISSLGYSGVANAEIELPVDFESKVHYLLTKALLNSSEPQWHQLRSYLDMWGHKSYVEKVDILTREDAIKLARAEKRALSDNARSMRHEDSDWVHVNEATCRISEELAPFALGEALRSVDIAYPICDELRKYLHIENTPIDERSDDYEYLLQVFIKYLTAAASSMPNLDLSRASIEDIRNYAEKLSDVVQQLVTEIGIKIAERARFLASDYLPQREETRLSDSKLNADVVVAATKAAWKIAERYFHPRQYGLPSIYWLEYAFNILTDNDLEITASTSPFLHINKDPYGLSLQCQIDYLRGTLLSLGYDADSAMEKDGTTERLADLEEILYQSPLIYIAVDPTVIGKRDYIKATKSGKQMLKKRHAESGGELRNKLLAVVEYARNRGEDLNLTRLTRDVPTQISHIDLHLSDLVRGVEYHEDLHGQRSRHYDYLATLITELGLDDVQVYEDKWKKVKEEYKRYQARE